MSETKIVEGVQQYNGPWKDKERRVVAAQRNGQCSQVRVGKTCPSPHLPDWAFAPGIARTSGRETHAVLALPSQDLVCHSIIEQSLLVLDLSVLGMASLLQMLGDFPRVSALSLSVVETPH